MVIQWWSTAVHYCTEGTRDKRKSRHVRNCDFSHSSRQIAIFHVFQYFRLIMIKVAWNMNISCFQKNFEQFRLFRSESFSIRTSKGGAPTSELVLRRGSPWVWNRKSKLTSEHIKLDQTTWSWPVDIKKSNSRENQCCSSQLRNRKVKKVRAILKVNLKIWRAIFHSQDRKVRFFLLVRPAAII